MQFLCIITIGVSALWFNNKTNIASKTKLAVDLVSDLQLVTAAAIFSHKAHLRRSTIVPENRAIRTFIRDDLNHFL